MTIQEIKDRLAIEHPNQYTDETIINWVNALEKDINTFLQEFEAVSSENIDTYSSMDDEVLLDEPDIYVEYLICRICLANEEYDRYNNHSTIFDARYTDWREKYIRSYMPIDRGGYTL